MPALQTITNHGTVSATSTAVTAKRLGRTAGGWPSIVRAEAVGEDYGDTYQFNSGTGTYANAVIRYGSTSSIFQNYTAYTSQDINGLFGEAPQGGVTPEVGIIGSRYNYRDGSQYRSLSYKPSTGNAYGVHIYQRYDAGSTTWRTVDAEIFVQAQNKPSAFSETLAASTLFLYQDNYGEGFFNNNDRRARYDAARWMYVPDPYTGWAGTTPSGVNAIDYSALLTRNCMGINTYEPVRGYGEFNQGFNSTDSRTLSLRNVDLFANSCDPMRLGVWDLDPSGNCKLATPFILRHRMRPVGTAGADFYIGPNLTPGFEVIVSGTEKYWSLGASLFLRQA